jgi:hypothetical protein
MVSLSKHRLCSVRILTPNERKGDVANDTSAREHFWAPVIEHRAYKHDKASAEVLESRVRRDLPLTLRTRLFEHVQARSRMDAPEDVSRSSADGRLDLLAGIFFRLENLSYGSLAFELGVVGIEKLAAFFNGDFEVLEIFLETYIPRDFERSVALGSDFSTFQFEIDVAPEVRSAFAAAPHWPRTTGKGDMTRHIPAQSPPSKSDESLRARWLWVISNTSLVLPVLLAAGILYVAFMAIAQEQTSARTMLEQLRVSRDKRIQELEERELKLLELLRSGRVAEKAPPSAGH